MTHRLIKNGEMMLYGPVGMVDWFNEGFTATEVIEALAEMEGDITVHINSGGGFAFDGIAISNALKAYDGKVTTINDAFAASAASIIFMAGAERLMADGSMLMIHNAAGITLGTAKDHRKHADVLDKLDGELARIYAKGTGKRAQSIRKMMDEETWMDADEAVSGKFATGTSDTEAAEATAFDYRVYANAPDKLKALANTKGWRNLTNLSDSPAPAVDKPRGDAAQPPSQEETMTDSEKAAAEAKAAAEKATAEAVEKAKADAKAEGDARVEAERKRGADITAACKLAGMPDKATAFISEGKSLSDVVTALQTERAKSDEISARNGTTTKPHDPNVSASWDKQVDKINKRVA